MVETEAALALESVPAGTLDDVWDFPVFCEAVAAGPAALESLLNNSLTRPKMKL